MFSNFTTKIIIFTLQPKIPSKTKLVQTVSTVESPNAAAGRTVGDPAEPTASEGRSHAWFRLLSVPCGTELVHKRCSAHGPGVNLFQSCPFIYFINKTNILYFPRRGRKRSHRESVPEFGRDTGARLPPFVLYSLFSLLIPSHSISVCGPHTDVAGLGHRRFWKAGACTLLLWTGAGGSWWPADVTEIMEKDLFLTAQLNAYLPWKTAQREMR